MKVFLAYDSSESFWFFLINSSKQLSGNIEIKKTQAISLSFISLSS